MIEFLLVLKELVALGGTLFVRLQDVQTDLKGVLAREVAHFADAAHFLAADDFILGAFSQFEALLGHSRDLFRRLLNVASFGHQHNRSEKKKRRGSANISCAVGFCACDACAVSRTKYNI